MISNNECEFVKLQVIPYEQFTLKVQTSPLEGRFSLVAI